MNDRVCRPKACPRSPGQDSNFRPVNRSSAAQFGAATACQSWPGLVRLFCGPSTTLKPFDIEPLATESRSQRFGFVALPKAKYVEPFTPAHDDVTAWRQ